MQLGENGSWLAPLGDAAPGSATVLCLPYAGAVAHAYRPMAAALPGVRVLAVELPGHGRRIREAPMTSVGLLADALAGVLAERETRETAAGPLILYGHSMGALLAYELAHRLAERPGPAVAHLVVSGCAPPRAARSADRPRHRMGDDELVADLVALGADPEPWSVPDIRAVALPPLRADLAAAELFAYTSRPPLRCPVTAVAGTDDPEAPPDSMAGWDAEAADAFALHVVAAGHYLLDTRLAEVARIVGELVRRS